jgi:hypothetical protein
MYNFYLGGRADIARDTRSFLIAVKRMLPRWANSLPDPEYNVLIDLLGGLRAKKPVFVETGVGASTLALIHFAMAKCGHVYSWDMNSAKGSFVRSVCADTLEPFHRKSIAAHWTFVSSGSLEPHTGLGVLRELTKRVDFTLHDSDHTWNNVRGEIEAVMSLLGPGALVCVDDANQDMVHTYEPIINVTRRKLGLDPIKPLRGNRGRPLFERVPQLLASRFSQIEAVATEMEKYIARDLYYPWYQLKRGSALAWYQSGGAATDAVAADEVKAHMKRFGVWRVSGAKAKRRPRQAPAVQSGEGK